LYFGVEVLMPFAVALFGPPDDAPVGVKSLRLGSEVVARAEEELTPENHHHRRDVNSCMLLVVVSCCSNPLLASFHGHQYEDKVFL